MHNTLLSVEHISKKFGALHATKDLTFSVNQGEIHAVIGPNGAGKTTLINQLTGDIFPDQGNIYFEGVNITAFAQHRRSKLGLARSYQITSIFNEMSVEDNIALALQPFTGHSFSFFKKAYADISTQERIRDGLEQIGLHDRRHERAKYLSHGEKRQLEVGMALMGKTKLLLLDEPMAGMGPGGTVEMSKLIKKLKKKGLTIVLIEHDMNVVFALADRVTVLVYGEVLCSGTAEEVKNNPQVQEAYLGEELADVET